MPSKADFNAEQWSLLRQGPAVAGILTSAADRGGTLREGLSIGQFYGEARALWTDPPEPVGLIEELIAAGPELDRERFANPAAGRAGEEVRQAGLELLRRAVGVLERSAGQVEVDDYRRLVLGVAQRVAEAHKEGGFLGIGGKPVSAGEQAVLDAIARAIGGRPPA